MEKIIIIIQLDNNVIKRILILFGQVKFNVEEMRMILIVVISNIIQIPILNVIKTIVYNFFAGSQEHLL